MENLNIKVQNYRLKFKINKSIFHFALSFLFLIFTFYILTTSSAQAGTIIKSPAYLGLQRGLVGCWNFDGAYTKVPDCSGNNSTGTITGATKVLGKVGQALDFDGINDSVNLSNPSSLNNITNKTISVWIYPRSINNGVADASVIINSDNTSTAFNWELKLCSNDGASCSTNTNTFTFSQKFQGGGGNEIWTAPSNTIVLNQWQHIVVTYNNSSTANNPTFYYNGSLITATKTVDTGSGAPGDDSTYQKNVGNWGDGSEPYKGSIDEVRFYNRLLSPAEISRLYRIGQGSTVNRSSSSLMRGLIGCWNFDGDYTKVPDCSGNNNTGTITGATKTVGKVGQGLDFGRTIGRYVDAGSPSRLDNITQKTICAWIYPRSYGPSATDSTIISKYNGSSWLFQLADDNIQALYYWHSTDANAGQWHTPASSITLNSWQHVCVEFDSSSLSNNASLYINGVSMGVTENSPPSGTAFAADAAHNLYVGNTQNGAPTEPSFDGIIDEVRFYNRFLSEPEIRNLYNESQSKLNSSPVDSLEKGLVGCWNFDGNYTKVPDCSGFGRTGTITGATKVMGKIGQALSFNGTSDVVTTGDVDVSAAFTISAWIKSDVLPAVSAYEDIVMRGQTPFANGDYWLAIVNDEVVVGIYNGGALEIVTTSANLVAGRWYHIVGTYSDPDDRVVIYINGEQSISGDQFTSALTNDRTVKIGGGTTNEEFDGLIDEVRIYNRALLAAEVRKLYNMSK